VSDEELPFIGPENEVVANLADTLRGNASKDLGQDIFDSTIAGIESGAFGGGESVRVQVADKGGFTLSGFEEEVADRLAETLERNASDDLGHDIFRDRIADVTTETETVAVVHVELEGRDTVSISVDKV
jgi:hypothetical protein